MINLVYLFVALLVVATFAQIRKTYYYSAVIFGKKPPFWVRLSGKSVNFVENLITLQIFDKK
jgi:hypothetical protein